VRIEIAGAASRSARRLAGTRTVCHRAAPWLALLAAYVAAIVGLGAADPAPQVPFVLARLRREAGLRATELALAVPAAAAFALAAALARRWVPDPWATRGVLLVALSPLGFALSSGAGPDAPAAALLAGGLVLALRVRDGVTRGRVVGSAACLALMPWLGLPYAVPALAVLAALASWTSRQGRPLLAFLAVEIAGASAVALLGVDQPVGRPATPSAGAAGAAAVVVDRDIGVLRWAPVLALALVGVYLLARSRREHVSKAIPARRDAEVAFALTGMAILGMWGAAAVGSVTPGAGVPLAAALGAWGLQRAPRTGAALGALTLAGTVWVAVALAAGDARGWLGAGSDAPWGPLVVVFPAF